MSMSSWMAEEPVKRMPMPSSMAEVPMLRMSMSSSMAREPSLNAYSLVDGAWLDQDASLDFHG